MTIMLGEFQISLENISQPTNTITLYFTADSQNFHILNNVLQSSILSNTPFYLLIIFKREIIHKFMFHNPLYCPLPSTHEYCKEKNMEQSELSILTGLSVPVNFTCSSCLVHLFPINFRFAIAQQTVAQCFQCGL